MVKTIPAFDLLYIKPTDFGNGQMPITDGYTCLMGYLLKRAAANTETKGAFTASESTGTGNGFFVPDVSSENIYTCFCGAESTNQDYLVITLRSKTYITNWLAVHYLACHRGHVPGWVFKLLEQVMVASGFTELPEPGPELLLAPASATPSTYPFPTPPPARRRD